jgi:hypothetical protein
MALITCPNCGKQVSDTTQICIHCGKPIKQTIEKEDVEVGNLKNYDDLDFSTKVELQKEFDRTNPKYEKYLNKISTYTKINRISNIVTIVAIVIAVLGLLMGTSKIAIVVLILALIVFFVSDIIDIACPFLIIRHKKKSLIVLKKYQKWLRETKSIDYHVTFSANERKWQKYFENINADFQDV